MPRHTHFLPHPPFMDRPMDRFLPTPMDPVLYKSITTGDLHSLNLYSSDDIIDKTTVSNNTALHVAAQSGVFSSSEVICNRCPSLVLKQNANGDTPLHIAARDGRTEIVRLLIKSQHQDQLLRMANKRMDTALHMAVRNNHFEAVKLLTEADPKLDDEYATNNAGETPLYLAAEDGRYQMVEHILKICPSSRHYGPDSRTTLQAAILRNRSDITNLLIKKDLKVFWQVDGRGWNVSVIKDITERYPDIWEAVDDDGWNFLHHAAWYNQIEVVKYVLGNNTTTDILLNCQTTKGDTPLHHAAYKENKEIVLLFVSDTALERR